MSSDTSISVSSILLGVAAHQSFQHFISACLCSIPHVHASPRPLPLCARPSPRPHCHVNDLFAPVWRRPAVHQSACPSFIPPAAVLPGIRSGFPFAACRGTRRPPPGGLGLLWDQPLNAAQVTWAESVLQDGPGGTRKRAWEPFPGSDVS